MILYRTLNIGFNHFQISHILKVILRYLLLFYLFLIAPGVFPVYFLITELKYCGEEKLSS